jgi:hypothetical protein
MPRRNSNARKVHRGPSSSAALEAKFGAVGKREKARARRSHDRAALYRLGELS